MNPDLNKSATLIESESHAADAAGWDPRLVAAVKDCQQPPAVEISENTMVALDDMGAMYIRRRAALLRSQVKTHDS
jgi:hypothetical protein